MVKPKKIKTFLWFDGQAEEAAKFYAAIFKNGGPQFKFNESVSFAVECDTQEEIDYYWDRLLAGGGKPSQCGWLKDRFGVSWQVHPAGMDKLFAGKKAPAVMQAMLQMVKFDIRKIKEAAK